LKARWLPALRDGLWHDGVEIAAAVRDQPVAARPGQENCCASLS
jgi:hypothetical protein